MCFCITRGRHCGMRRRRRRLRGFRFRGRGSALWAAAEDGTYIEERFLDCACRHPSQQTRRMEEKNRQAPLGMTWRTLGLSIKGRSKQRPLRKAKGAALGTRRKAHFTPSMFCRAQHAVPLRKALDTASSKGMRAYEAGAIFGVD